jgi:NAD(P)-dependent dehydrogenase (short-subunit alcohol dehydrogenase family)
VIATTGGDQRAAPAPLDIDDLSGTVAVITGAAQGIGAAVARRLAAGGADVVLGDVATEVGEVVAEEIGGTFQRTDVRDPDDSAALIALAVERYGGVDVVHLNAGVTSGTTFGDEFDVARYRRAIAINLDGVVFGVQAALPALRARGGGRIVATASMAGLVATMLDPFYAANKHAVVGLVRCLGNDLGPEGILVNALCPSFAETAIIDDLRPFLEEMSFPILDVEDVVTAFGQILASDRAGECWFVVPGRESEPFRFRNAPGPR